MLLENRIARQKKALIKALEKNLGVITYACKDVKVTRNTFYKYMREDPEFKKEAEAIDDVALDYVEKALHSQIKDGSTAATIFYLKTKGRKRGYIEKQNNPLGDNVKSITVTVEGAKDNLSGESD